VAVRSVCPAAQQCANRDARIKVLESEIDRLRGLDLIRQDVANLMQEEIDDLKRKLGELSAPEEPRPKPSTADEPVSGDDRFRRAKIAISKALHPNNFAHDKLAAMIRGEIFKELWPEIERIERR
jgi:hypothetical protein